MAFASVVRMIPGISSVPRRMRERTGREPVRRIAPHCSGSGGHRSPRLGGVGECEGTKVDRATSKHPSPPQPGLASQARGVAGGQFNLY